MILPKSLNENWLTIPEATAYIKRKSKVSIYKYMQLHGIRRTKVLRNTLVSRVDIDRALEDNAIAA